ncbi:DNA replication/repair protein RecF [bacterium]|nr:MAG: DNA replication/repair protein RecF [bacterium]
MKLTWTVREIPGLNAKKRAGRLYWVRVVFISELQITNYRNYVRAGISLDRGLNLFVGDNAQGKSNLLEAIYLLSTLRSSRASSDADLVRRDIIGSEFPVARLECQVDRSAGNLHLEVAIVGRTTDASHRAGKRVRVNGVPRRASDAVGQLCAVLFSTLDIEIVAGPPLLRRRYLDMMISQVDRGYLRAMQRYAKVLQQRNSLLKRVQAREASAGELNFWDQELAHAGGIIMKARADALGSLVPEAAHQMQRLSDGQESLHLTYRPSLGGLDDSSLPIDETEWIARMLKALTVLRGREIGAGATIIGPHRDDVTIEIDGMPADAYASRAQQRIAALSLRLAEASYLRNVLGDDPVVLLDDVLSELDARRRKGVLEFFDNFQQTIVTTAEPDRVREVMTRASGRFIVSAGALTRFEGE